MAGDARGRRGLLMVGAPVFVAAVAVGLVVALALSSRSDDGTATASAASSTTPPPPRRPHRPSADRDTQSVGEPTAQQ